MAKGNGKGRDVQEQILDELRSFRGDLRAEVQTLNDRLAMLREDLTLRLDKLIENTGAHWRDLERRVSALESWRDK